MYVCMYGWMDGCMHACMHACMYKPPVKFGFQNVDWHIGDKWLIHGTKHHKANKLLSLELARKKNLFGSVKIFFHYKWRLTNDIIIYAKMWRVCWLLEANFLVPKYKFVVMTETQQIPQTFTLQRDIVRPCCYMTLQRPNYLNTFTVILFCKKICISG